MKTNNDYELLQKMTVLLATPDLYFDFNIIPNINTKFYRSAIYDANRRQIKMSTDKVDVQGVTGKGAALFVKGNPIQPESITLLRTGLCLNIERALELNHNRERVYKTFGVNSSMRYAFDKQYRENMNSNDWFEPSEVMDIINLSLDKVGLFAKLERICLLRILREYLNLPITYSINLQNSRSFIDFSLLANARKFILTTQGEMLKKALDLLSTSFLNLLSIDTISSIDHAKRLSVNRDIVRACVHLPADQTFKKMNIKYALREIGYEDLLRIINSKDASNEATSIAYASVDGVDRGRLNEILAYIAFGPQRPNKFEQGQSVYTIEGRDYLLSRDIPDLNLSYAEKRFLIECFKIVYLLADAEFRNDRSDFPQGYFVLGLTDILRTMDSNIILRIDREDK